MRLNHLAQQLKSTGKRLWNIVSGSPQRAWDGETHLVHAFLAGDDYRLRKVLANWDLADSVVREFTDRTNSAYRVYPGDTFQCLSHRSLGDRVQSNPVDIVTAEGQPLLQCSIEILTGTNVILKVATVDGSPIPNCWKLSSPAADLLSEGSLQRQLPTMSDQAAGVARLKNWMPDLEISDELLPWIEVFSPARDSSIRQLSELLRSPLPPSFEEFLKVTDGILIGESYLEGTRLQENVSDYLTLPFRGMVVCGDVINGLDDGFYFMSLDHLSDGQIWHASMYGEVQVAFPTLREFLSAQFGLLLERYQKFLPVLATATRNSG